MRKAQRDGDSWDMTQTKRYRNEALRSLHEVAEDLHAVGAIDKATMRDFDLGCLTPVEPLAPEAIRHIREQSHMSQATFARALNVSTVLISKWERGEVRPSGPCSSFSPLQRKRGSKLSFRCACAPDAQRSGTWIHKNIPRSLATAFARCSATARMRPSPRVSSCVTSQ